MTTKGTQRIFSALLPAHGLPEPVAEYRFHPIRRWRADFAWPDAKLLLEVEGGVFLLGGGRHNRGAGLRKDLEKYNAAAALGYRVLRVLPEQLLTQSTVDLVRRCLQHNP